MAHCSHVIYACYQKTRQNWFASSNLKRPVTYVLLFIVADIYLIKYEIQREALAYLMVINDDGLEHAQKRHPDTF